MEAIALTVPLLVQESSRVQVERRSPWMTTEVMAVLFGPNKQAYFHGHLIGPASLSTVRRIVRRLSLVHGVQAVQKDAIVPPFLPNLTGINIAE